MLRIARYVAAGTDGDEPPAARLTLIADLKSLDLRPYP
jgi:hypothetical protein